MASSTIKAVLISAGLIAIALFLMVSVPMASDFSLSHSPVLWSSFFSWLKPPYLFVAVNVIIIIIVASSIYHGGEYNIETDESIINNQAPLLELEDLDLDADFDFPVITPPSISVTEVEISEFVSEEKEEKSDQINGRDEFVVLKSKVDEAPSMVEESENLPPTEKSLSPVRSGHRKPFKTSLKGGNKRKTLRVGKPKQQQEEKTMENTWKMITEDENSTSLTTHYRRSDTLKLGDGEVKHALRKAETFRDMTNYQKSTTVTASTPVKMKKEMSPSRDELNRRVEAFIKKCKEERIESMRLDKVVS
ncbi:unnamed protein product [Cochlearia groenlandica]